MSKDLLALYQQIRETPALTVDLPEKSGKGRIVRLDTNIFSLSSWNMEFSKDTFVEGKFRMTYVFSFAQETESSGPRNADRCALIITKLVSADQTVLRRICVIMAIHRFPFCPFLCQQTGSRV